MPRRVLIALSIISLFLFGLIVLMWVRSYFVQDVYLISKGINGINEVWFSSRGEFGKGYSVILPGNTKPSLIGMSFSSYLSWASTFVYLPFFTWASMALRRQIQTANPYACKRCGYDLRATPDRCPECGTAQTKPT